MLARQRGWQRDSECPGFGNPKPLAQSWLDIQCKMITGVSRALVLFGHPDGGFYSQSAHWPSHTDRPTELEQAAHRAIRAGQCTVESGKRSDTSNVKPASIVACPLNFDNAIAGAVIVEISDRPQDQQDAVKKLLQWGSLWLQFSMRQENPTVREPKLTLFRSIATCLENDQFQAAATALATELTDYFRCSRVSLGLLKGKRIQVRALSHSARFDAKSNLLRAIAAAMDEAVDQNASIIYPSNDETAIRITRAHEQLAKQHESPAICSTPLHHAQQLIGGLTLERQSGENFDSAVIQTCEQIAAFAGPILELKYKNERSIPVRVCGSIRGLLRKPVAPRHGKLKLGTIAIVGLLAFLSLVNGDYRITADATLEGRVQRVIVAPQQGFIATTDARAGDLVRTGDLLGSLDEKDLNLERFKWNSQHQQLLKEFREALANHERTQVSILSAQVKQAEAQIELIDQQLARTQLIAPFDGIIIAGDLSQSLGSPVERGDVLFKIAPLDQYRLILKVDERDIAAIKVGQTGRLILSSLPGEHLDLAVETITPVSETDDARNYFRVEARLDAQHETLRPGMQGIGKIFVDRRKLAWIWTHDIADWLRLWSWYVWP